MARTGQRLSPGDLAEAARMLAAIVESLPPRNARERATARRMEGASAALDAVSIAQGDGREVGH